MNNIFEEKLILELTNVLDVRVFNTETQKKVHKVFASLDNEELDYGTTITYLRQQIHGFHFPGITDSRGYVYLADDKTVIPFVIARRPLDGKTAILITCPRGENTLSGITTLTQVIRNIRGDHNHENNAAIECDIYIRKPTSALKQQITAHHRLKQDIVFWNDKAIYEDDTYPNIKIDLDDLTSKISPAQLAAGGSYRKLKDNFNALRNKLAREDATLDNFTLEPIDSFDWPDAEKIINGFFAEKEERGHLSKPVDYHNIFQGAADWRPDTEQSIIRAFACFKGEKLGLVAAERIGNSKEFGCYSMLAIHPASKIWTFSEIEIVLLFQEIHKRGGQIADLGGAETKSLQAFHAKFLSRERSDEKQQKLSPTTKDAASWLQMDF